MGRALKDLTDHRNDRVYTLARTYTHARTHAVFCSCFFCEKLSRNLPDSHFLLERIWKNTRYPLDDFWVKDAIFISFSIIDLHYRMNYLCVSVSLYQNQ